MTAGEKILDKPVRVRWHAEEPVRAIGALADKEKTPVYAVGGYVRDCLLSKTPQEIDFTVVGDGVEFARKAKRHLGGKGLVVFERFGTASFGWEDFRFEFVTARKEHYIEDSRKPDVETGDLGSDLERRDFTINTLAARIGPDHFGEIIDAFHGQEDIRKKLIRTPLDPEKTFSDDPLRIMRAARFANQLEFQIDPRTLKAMVKERERLRIVSQERITDEFLKILSFPKPSIGLRILEKTGILTIVFPELSALVGVEQISDYHHKDVFEHTLKVVDNMAQVTKNPCLRFAALTHDIGKPKVKRFIEGIGWTFYGHELVGVRMLREICTRLRLSKEYCKVSQKMTRLHMRPIHLIGEEVTDSAIRRLLVQVGADLDDLMALCRADITSGNPKRVRQHLVNFEEVVRRMKEVEDKDRMRAFQSPVRGDEIMEACGIGPGPLVGRLKKALEEAILEGQIPNEHDEAFRHLLKVKDEVIKQSQTYKNS